MLVNMTRLWVVNTARLLTRAVQLPWISQSEGDGGQLDCPTPHRAVQLPWITSQNGIQS
jgi:hypothetical protein